MSTPKLVPALLFRAATTALEKSGACPEKFVEKMSVPFWHHCKPETLVPGDHFYRLVGQAALELGIDNFGYLVARHTPLTALDAFGERTAASLTVYDAVKTFNRLYALMSSIDYFYIIEDSEGIWWLRKRLQETKHLSGQQVELGVFLYMIQTVRLGAGSGWIPEKICLEAQSQEALVRLNGFGNAAIRERQGKTGIFIPRSLLAQNIRAKRPSTLLRKTSKLFSEAPNNELPDSLRQLLRAYLSFGQPNIEEVADAAGMGVRTLQRRLQEHGLTYKLIVDQASFQQAQEYLHDPDFKLVEVSQELGYGDQANFNRAFRRWAGMTPGEYRLQLHAR